MLTESGSGARLTAIGKYQERRKGTTGRNNLCIEKFIRRNGTLLQNRPQCTFRHITRMVGDGGIAMG